MPVTDEQRSDNQNFKQKCILNFPQDIDMKQSVYRVFPINRLLQLFKEKKNTLVKPSMWDDPFENVLLQQQAKTKEGIPVSFRPVREQFYGQCWTLNQEKTDALWRIYSPNKDGVRVKTTLQKLWDSFYNEEVVSAYLSYFIGKIEYAEETEIKKFFENSDNVKAMLFPDPSGKTLVQSLLIKRKEFEHENEVRLIYRTKDTSHNTGNNIFQYPFNPNSIIDELLFDPRFDTSLYEHFKECLGTKMSFTGTISKSSLYQVPELNIVLDL